ncbi:IS110 family RNA-guided transposase [Parabacteroides pacaensis]|uniref:IS110 family transposase n=1 Tax=Parabacteroides pacaensis TaxID=2086575 RepID=UPI00131DCF4E|nr:IS110 family transposase [Parabacteroides pacaensis]
MEKLVIGIDFSKETMNFCCLQGSVDGVVLEGAVSNDREGCREMIRKLRALHNGLKVCDFLFCGENTGCYSLEVADYLFSKKYLIWLENPLQIKLSSGMRREKTDAADARMIAEYAFRYHDKAKGYNPQPKSIQKLKAWLKAHDYLRGIKVSLQNLLQSMPVVPGTLQETLEDIVAQLKQTDKKIRELLKKEDEFSMNASLMMSVPGISCISTAAILVDTCNFTRFTNPRKYATHTGCVPHKHDSGTTIHRKPQVSKASNRYINSLLTQGAVSLITHNQEIKEYVIKKKKEGKHTGCIINNIRNKIIHRLFAVIREQKSFDPNHRCEMQKKMHLQVGSGDTSF